MGMSGTPEAAARRFGAEIARLRELRGISRSKLVIHLYYAVGEDSPLCDTFNDAWLARLETGKTVKISREVLDALCLALRCSPRERRRLLLMADRSVFLNENGEPDALAELLNDIFAEVYEDAREVLDPLLGRRELHNLTEVERQDMVRTALEVAIRAYRR